MFVYYFFKYLNYTFNRRQQKLSWLCNTGLLTYLREQLHKYGAVRKSVEEARQDSIYTYPTRPLSLPADFIRLICAYKSFLQLLFPSPLACLLPRLYFSLSASISHFSLSSFVKTKWRSSSKASKVVQIFGLLTSKVKKKKILKIEFLDTKKNGK